MSSKKSKPPVDFDENPEWTKENFARARPFREVFPNLTSPIARPPTHPGELMHEILSELAIPVSEAAKRMKVSLSALRDVLSGDASVTPEIALPFAELVSGEPELYVQMQAKCDLWAAGLAQRLVISDPEIMGGVPVFRGTRISVHQVAELTARGASEAELLDDYPRLTAEMISLARPYASAYPLRGRTRKQPWHDGRPVHQSRRKLEPER
jgi:addiction module HigA family antidote